MKTSPACCSPRSHRFARAFCFCLTAVLLASLWLTPPSGSTQTPKFINGREVETVNGQEAAAGEVLVKFRSSASKATIDHLASRADASENVPVGGAGTRLIKSRSLRTSALINELSMRADVEYVEPNYVAYGGLTPNDPSFPQMYGLKNTGQHLFGVTGVPGADVSAEGAWDVFTGSRDTVVAVIDSGIDYNHPDLAANVWTAPAPFSVNIRGVAINCPAGSHGFNAITNSCDPLDDHNHGTHVSGTIGAVGNNGVGVTGVNWTANIMASKWLNSNNSGFISDAIDAIEFAIQAKQQLGSGANVRVLNNSWFSNSFSNAVGDQIVRAQQNGMLFVALAGNNGTDNDVIPRTPSGHKVPNVIGVSATDNRDELASFSNWGKTTVHLGAPGVNILSTLLGPTYSVFSGTSMSTPHVAGAALLLLGRCQMTIAGVKGIILTNTDTIPSLVDKTTTNGRLNVSKSINACAAVSNVVDNGPFFVRQHYVDFFSREPDAPGLAFWSNEIAQCGGDPGCVEVKRINVSAAFFVSIEFQETGFLVYRMYKAAFGNIPGGPVPVRFEELVPDTQIIGQGVVVNQGNWQQQLENNKQAFMTTFVSRSRFANAYPTSMSPATFVNTLFSNAGVTPSPTDRNAAINEFGGAGNTSDTVARGRALRRVAENATLGQQEFNRAFVLMQYFGYLRRNPYDPPELTLDFQGYNFWLDKLNQFGGNYIEAEMVKAFINSTEYRLRFGS